MNINWHEASTRRGFVGLVIFVVGIFLITTGADEKAVVTLLLLGKGVSDYLKFTLPDRKE